MPKLTKVASKMPPWFAAVTNKEISQIIKLAVPKIHEADDVKFTLEVLTGKALFFFT